jgi:hypothetical protein
MSFGFGFGFPRSLLAKAVAALYGLFIPSGSDRLITSDGDVFRVTDP